MAEQDLDVSLIHGRPDMPACVLIHGVGMNKYFWSSPEEARVMGSLLPLTSMLKGYGEMRTLYHDLSAEGFTVITWSQRRPVGPASAAVEELHSVMDMLADIPHRGLILTGHSRGGLIARSALSGNGFQPEDERLLGLVTLCTPHSGSELSRWAQYAGRLTSVISDRIEDPGSGRGIAATIKGMTDFVESRGVREILPGSGFLGSLPGTVPGGVYTFSIGGTNPALLSIPGVFSFPGSLEAVFPSSIFPEEMSEGRGDGLVSARSARLPGVMEHIDFPVSHAGVIVDPEVRRAVLERIRKHCMP